MHGAGCTNCIAKTTPKGRRPNTQARKGQTALTSQRQVQSTAPAGLGKNSQRMKGTERILTVTANSSVQHTCFSFFDLLSAIPGSRIVSLMKVYEMMFVHGLKFRFVPTLAKTAPGTIYMAPDYDPKDLPPLPANAANEISSMLHAVSGPLSGETVCGMPNHKLPCGQYAKPTLYISPTGNTRLSNYGRILIFVEGHAGATTDVVGHLVVEYDLTLAIPQPYPGDYWEPVDASKLQAEVDLTNYLPVDKRIGANPTAPALAFAARKAAGTGMNMFPTEVYTGIVGPTSTASLHTITDRVVEAGTRIFWRAIQGLESSVGVLDTNFVTGEVGNINLNDNFDSRGALNISGISATFISILNAMKA